MASKILLVGLRSDSVDFSKWPDITAESLQRAFEEVKEQLVGAGYTVRWCLTDAGETARDVLRDALTAFAPDVVSIGAGVRADPDHLRLFEDFVNLTRDLAPAARFAFNTDPMDTVRSVKRAAGRDRAT